MKRLTWKKHHKWLGIGFAFFMLMFCISGIVLNHRAAFADFDVSRSCLPSSYRFSKWNGGVLRGTLKGSFGTDSILIYGNSGIWTTCAGCEEVHDFNKGFLSGADYKNIKSCVQAADGSLWAAGQFGLYRYDSDGQTWQTVTLPLAADDKLSDLTLKQDTLVAVGRSYLYVSAAPYQEFHRLEVKVPADDDGKVSLFRTIWSLHSGELFGLVGKLLMDGVAIILILLCITGIAFWLFPKSIRRAKANGKSVKRSAQWMKKNFDWHDSLGRYTFGILLFVAVTGWSLRPPVLIALVKGRVPAIPYTIMDSDNAWRDRLRMLRYDATCDDWLLSTSEGLYQLKTLDGIPSKVTSAPPISVMGLNAWEKDVQGNWLMGSFSGMFVWNRKAQVATDYFTGEITKDVAGPPFGKFAVSGYTEHLADKPVVVEYNQGTDAADMPTSLSTLPISLWNLALEVHTGRIYTLLGPATLIYIFFAGIAAAWCLYSGYKIRKSKTKNKLRGK